MDSENDEQYSLYVEQVGDRKDWLNDNMEGIVALMLDVNGEGIEPPPNAELEIKETAPVIKGA